MTDPINIFLGGGPEHWLPLKVLEYSIQRRTDRDVRIHWLLHSQIPVPVPAEPKNRQATSFSFQRFLIPEALNFEGHGIYLDSDMLVQQCIGDLWDTPLPHNKFVAIPPDWQTAVMLIDAKAGWRIAEFVAALDSGDIKHGQLMNLKGVAFERIVHQGLDPLWNCHDRQPEFAKQFERAKLIHYTTMNTQPWLKTGHIAGKLWEEELVHAMKADFINKVDIMREIGYGHVRPSLSIVAGVFPPARPDSEFVMPHKKAKVVA